MVARRDRMAIKGNGCAFRSRGAGIVSQTVWYGISLSSSWLVQRVVCHLFRFTSVSLSNSVSLSYSDQNTAVSPLRAQMPLLLPVPV